MRDHRLGRRIRWLSSLALGLLLSLRGGAFAETPHNDFSTDALKGDTRFLIDIASTRLTTNDLRTLAASKPRVADALNTSRGRELMGYAVSCALSTGTMVTYTSPPTSSGVRTTDKWPGELGLCSGRAGISDWSARPASMECQQLVTACVLARINAFGRKVRISLRDVVEGSSLLPLDPSVSVEQEYRDRGGITIDSFRACPDSRDRTTNTNCGWVGHYVGTCSPDHPMTVWVRNSTASFWNPDSSRVHTRICQGIYGCNRNDPTAPPPAEPCSRDYTGIIAETTEPNTSISFMCPKNGYFSVMYKPWCNGWACWLKREGSFDPLVEVYDDSDRGKPVRYPAPERDVFTYPEGAFYGNFFSDEINICAIVTPNQVNSCASGIWSSSGPAYLNQRICAGEQCFNHDPKSCPDACPDAFNVRSTPLLCGASKTRALMVYLNDPRDLSPPAPPGAPTSCGAAFCTNTCNDGIQDYGEQGVDCGGSCPSSCGTCTPIAATTCTADLLNSVNSLVTTVNSIAVPLETRTVADRLPCPVDTGVGENNVNIFSYVRPLDKNCNRLTVDDCTDPARRNYWVAVQDARREGDDPFGFGVIWGSDPLNYYYYGTCSPDPSGYDNAEAGIPKLLQPVSDANGDGSITPYCTQTHVYRLTFYTVDEGGVKTYIPKANIKKLSSPFLADPSLVIPGVSSTDYGELSRSGYVAVRITLKQPTDQVVTAYVENNHNGTLFMKWKEAVTCTGP